MANRKDQKAPEIPDQGKTSKSDDQYVIAVGKTFSIKGRVLMSGEPVPELDKKWRDRYVEKKIFILKKEYDKKVKMEEGE